MGILDQVVEFDTRRCLPPVDDMHDQGADPQPLHANGCAVAGLHQRSAESFAGGKARPDRSQMPNPMPIAATATCRVSSTSDSGTSKSAL